MDDEFEIISNAPEVLEAQSPNEPFVEIINEMRGKKASKDGNGLEEIQNFVNNLNIYYVEIYKIEEGLEANVKLVHSTREYFTLPLRLYYSVMILIALLKVREKSDSLTNEEKCWLHRFERNYPLKDLYIARQLVPVFDSFKSFKTTERPEEPVKIDGGSSNINNLLKVGIDEIELVFMNHPKLIFDPIVTFGTQLRNLLNPQDDSDDESETDEICQETDETNAHEKTCPSNTDVTDLREAEESLTTKWTSKELPEPRPRLGNKIYYWSKNPSRYFPDIEIFEEPVYVSLQKLEITGTLRTWLTPCCYAAMCQTKYISESTTLNMTILQSTFQN
jgi:hypothetical protein